MGELRLQRPWARSKRMLEAGRDPLAVIEAAKDDPDSLRALRVELPAYLEAKNSGGIFDGVRAALDQAEYPHLNSVKRKARQIQGEVERAEYLVSMAQNIAYQELEGAGGTLPAHDGGAINM